MKTFYFFLISLITLVSCSRELSTTSTNTIKKENVDVNNTLNPYDNIGLEHNAILNQLLFNDDSRSAPVTTAEKFNSVCSQLSISSEAKENLIIGIQEDSFENNFSYLNSKISNSIVRDKTNYILSKIHNDLNEGEINNLTQFVSCIKSIETEILSDPNIPQESKQEILSFCSVYRQSSANWEMKLSSTSSTSSTSTTLTRGLKHWWQWLIFGAADAIGGFAGGGFNVSTSISASSLAYTVMK